MSMKLGLGTVQLGINYGVNNTTGKPERKEALDILSYAYENGIDTFDTAAAYGDSETIIGEFIRENDLSGKIKIASKGKFRENGDTVETSLRNLGVNVIYYYLLHDPSELPLYYDKLCGYVREGKIKKIGVSVYDSAQIEECLLYEQVKVIQVPFNMLDNRLIKNGMLGKMKEKGIEIHARSVYLQGLLLMGAEEAPKHLLPLLSLQGGGNCFEILDRLAEERGLTRKQILFAYAVNNIYIDKLFVGCENIRQLKENLEMCQITDTDFKLPEEFSNVPETILNPSLWGKQS